MTGRESHQGDEDLAFEQLLLNAGKREPLPTERTEAALLRFSAGVGALKAGLPDSTGHHASLGARSWSHVARWVALGAVAGGALTFVWMRGTQPAPPSSASPALAIASTTARAANTRIEPPPPSETPASAASSSATPRGPARVGARGPSAETTRGVGAQPPPSATAAGASLAAEVAALDAIQAAIAIGAWQDAERRLSGYRRDFARGALRSEAEVLGITCLLGQGRKQAAASAAQLFIARHPRDPQVARVRALALSE